MLSLWWTQYELWIVSGLAIIVNFAALVFNLLMFFRYTASHPGSWGHSLFYLILSSINAFAFGWVVYHVRKAWAQIRRHREGIMTDQERAQLVYLEDQRAMIRLQRELLARITEPDPAPTEPAPGPTIANPAAIPVTYHQFLYHQFFTTFDPPDRRTPEQRMNAEKKAAVNLARIVEHLKCEPFPNPTLDQPAYILRAKGWVFVVDPSYIMRLHAVGHERTCYQLGVTCPRAEKVATALLQLHRNPSFFDFLKNCPGQWLT